MEITGNKGEWSEFYAFIKILTDGKIFTADKNLEILKENFYIVLKIIREESAGPKSYDVSRGDGSVVISDILNEKEKKLDIIELNEIKSGVAKIFNEMKDAKGASFKIKLAKDVMKKLHCSQIKASSGKKADLIIILHDKRSPSFPELGFSIKSMLGSASTLLNASGATNFTYKIKGKGNRSLANMNGNMIVRDKTKEVYGLGNKIEFFNVNNEAFRKNLRKIDSNFPLIIAEVIKNYYLGKGSRVSELIDFISKDKELCEKTGFDKSDLEYKMKNFLSAIALGMTPAKEWDGYTKAHGGYIIVKENGEIVCYHLYNRDEFEEYLYNNTKLDTPSTTKHKFGDIYSENGENFIKYNLQIRFIR